MTHRSPASTVKQSLPMFGSREEEAAFWDTHDVSDYFDASDFAPGRLDIEPGEERPVFFDARTLRILRAEAARRGMDFDMLISLLLLERLEQLGLDGDSAGT
jgi:CopG antitoxin of type II toxin-antitoxin system